MVELMSCPNNYYGRRNVVGLALMNAFRGVVVGGYMALYGLYLAYLGFDMGVIGLASTIASLVGAIISPPVGCLIEKWGSKLGVILSGLALTLASLILVVSKTLPLLVISYTLFMTSFLMGQVARSVFLVHSIGIEGLGANVGVTSAVFSIARCIGPVTAGFIAYSVGFKLAFLFLTVFSIIGLIVFQLTTTQPPRGTGREKYGSLIDAYRQVFKPNPLLSFAYIVTVLDRFGWSLWFPMLSAHMYNYGYNEAIVGLLGTIQSAAQATTLPLLGKLTDKLGSTNILMASEILATIATLLLINPTPWLRALIAYVLVGLSIAAWIPSFSKLVALATNGNKLSEAYASVNTIRIIPSIPAPLMGGILYDVIGPIAPYGSSAIILTISTIILAKKSKEK